MKKALLVFLAALCTQLSGCGLVDPFIDSRREAGTTFTVGLSRPSAPSICYNPWVTRPEAVLELAGKACDEAGGKEAVFVSQERFSCRFFLPARVNFVCREKEKDAGPQTGGNGFPPVSEGEEEGEGLPMAPLWEDGGP